MKYTLLLLIVFGYSSVAQEKVIKGQIKNSQDQALIGYTNIGINNKSAGTISDSVGQFSLKLNENIKNSDTITISHIGFKTKKIICSNLNESFNVIELEPESQILKDVVVKFVKPKNKRLGRTLKGLGLMHFNFYSAYETDVDDRLSKEVGMRLNLKNDCKIKSFNFNITSNDFKLLKFRLSFYDIKEGLPTELIVDKDIIFEISNGFLGWYNLDLDPYEIYLDKELDDILVTIQWVESLKKEESSKYFAISTAMSPVENSYYREKSLDKWKTSGQSLSFYLDALCK